MILSYWPRHYSGGVMNAMKMVVVVVVGMLLAATPASAMTGQEFLLASDKNTEDEVAVLKSLVRQFIREGYHSVPDWAHLGTIARALILEKRLPRQRHCRDRQGGSDRRWHVRMSGLFARTHFAAGSHWESG
jgi:hypothetical protein